MVPVYCRRALVYSRPFLHRSRPLGMQTSCSYHIHSKPQSDGSINSESMARNDMISRRLYRILLRSCKQGVGIANKDNNINNVGNGSCLLLQPPMDPRKYGFAKIVKARRGETLQQGKDSPKTESGNIGMAMEVLRFVHMQLGGDESDDLHHYYLGVSAQNNSGDNSSSISAAAGRHSDGHYTQFLDESEERGKDLAGTYGDVAKNADEDEEDNSEDELEFDESILATTDDLVQAVRIAFRAPLVSSTPSDEERWPKQTIIQRRHRDAIDVSNLFSEQLRMWSGKSSVSVDLDRGVRVVATSSCLMHSSASVGGVSGVLDKESYKFAYRIRIENIADILDTDKQPPSDKSDDSSVEHRAVQLLGRTWRISEIQPKNQKPSSLLQSLMNENNQEAEEELVAEIQVVNEPRTGAVGHLPVLGPGEVFEYMSGAELTTPTGQMEGCFHMANVDMQTTDSAHVGNPVEALSWAQDDERRFEAKVERFGFLVDDYNEK